MTNAEKFEEVFGIRHDSHVWRKDKRDTKLINTQTFWKSEFKKPKEDTTFTFGNKNKVSLLINIDENTYKTINHGFLDAFEIRDVREAIINGRKIIGETENNDAKWIKAIKDIKADIEKEYKLWDGRAQDIIDKHTEKLLKAETNGE